MSSTGYEYAASTETFLNHVVDEQWRYRCPDAACRSTAVAVRRQIGDVKKHSEWNPAYFKNDPHVHQFRCDCCGETFDDPYDAKHDERRQLHLNQ